MTPDSLHTLLTDLFETVTLWDLKTEKGVVEKTDAGEYRVTLDVEAKKMRADSQGKGEVLGASLYLQRNRIHSGKQTIVITVPQEPAQAGIDPYHKLIDREAGDNVVDLESETSSKR